MGFVIVALKGAGRAEISVMDYIYRSKAVNLIYADGANPYHNGESPANTFYVHPKMVFTPVETIWKSNPTNFLKEGYLNLLVLPSTEMTGPESIRRMKKYGFILEYQNIPKIVQHMPIILAIGNTQLHPQNPFSFLKLMLMWWQNNLNYGKSIADQHLKDEYIANNTFAFLDGYSIAMPDSCITFLWQILKRVFIEIG